MYSSKTDKRNRVIELSRGLTATVDDSDFEWLNQWKWHADTRGYAVRSTYNRGDKQPLKSVYMHRAVNNTPDGMVTDHINHNKLDNRRANLRTCRQSDNIANQKIRSNNTSGYKGVVRRRTGWQAEISYRKVKRYLGNFHTKELAARAYNEAAVSTFGKYAKLNELEV
jgi:hypothetical protein